MKTIHFLGVFIVIFCLISCAKQAQQAEAPTGYYEPLVDTILNHSSYQFKELTRENVSFYYEETPFFEASINRLKDDALASLDHCVAMLGNKRPTYKLRVIYFDDREKLRPFIHMAPKGLALPDAFTLLIATNDTIRAYHTHELMHIISINQFGGYAAEPTDWIQEGIAVYADNPCMSYPIHSIAAYLLHTGKLSSLDSLFNHFRALPDMAGYMEAGSVVQYIVEQYGLEKYEQLWQAGAAQLPFVIGKSVEEFENEYQHFLRRTYPQPPEIDWELLSKKGCG